MQEVAKLPMMELDCNISFTITTTQTNKDKKNGYIHLQVPKAGSKTWRGRWDFPTPYQMRFRICRVLLDNGEFQTVATSLLPRPLRLQIFGNSTTCAGGWKLPSRGLKYMLGWSISTGSLMLQELYADLTAFNFASRVCC